jgi:hypothetical protein
MPAGSERGRGGFLPWAVQIDELRKMRALSPDEWAGSRAPPVPLVESAGTGSAPCTVCGALTGRRCSGCRQVSYCSERHRDDDLEWHARVCDRLREIAGDDAVRARCSALELATEIVASRPAGERVPADWSEYLGAGAAAEPARRRVQTDLASRPLTIARALARLSIAPREGRLSVHVVAAARAEIEVPRVLYQELRRWWPGVRFDVAFVGPELPGDAASRLGSADDLVFRFHAEIYRRALWQRIGQPDLVVGFDCGLLLYPSWQPTVMDLIGRRVPFAVTSYRSWEQAAEAKLLGRVGAELLLAPEPNPFASLAARRSTTLVNDVSHDNALLLAFR